MGRIPLRLQLRSMEKPRLSKPVLEPTKSEIKIRRITASADKQEREPKVLGSAGPSKPVDHFEDAAEGIDTIWGKVFIRSSIDSIKFAHSVSRLLPSTDLISGQTLA